MKKLALTIALAVSLTATAQDFSPTRIKATMNFLASDLLEGRGTGTRGYMVAAQYVAAQYEAMGLEPGANGSWFQTVPFRKTSADEASTVTLRRGDQTLTLKLREDFTTSGDPLHAETNIDAPVVYVGYGITTPAETYDDYKGLDVKGKIVAYFSGAPSTFSSDVRAHYAASITKAENAAAHGAVGVITLRAERDRKRAPWERVVRQSRLGAMNWLDGNGTPRGVAGVSFSLGISDKAAAFLLGNDSDALSAEANSRARAGFATGASASIHIVSKYERVDSPNVVGILRGTTLPDEYVVYSAHLDHLGISTPVNGDSINNGALDNASGIAAMLEVARAFANGPRPRRSIIFLATTGEEKGLKGADYFANNPVVPAHNIVADINIDEIFLFTPTRDVVAIGAEHSTLLRSVQHAAAEMNLELSPDPQPEEVVFVRSDQYPFVKRGIPAVYVGSGYKPVDTTVDLMKRIQTWEETIYHTPKDDMTQQLDFTVGATVAKFDYLVGLDVANADKRPTWVPNDFFGEVFAVNHKTGDDNLP